MVGAARVLVDGDWTGACKAFDRVLVEYPRDVLALQTAHLFDFYRGDSLNLRNRIARVLPAWNRNVPGYSYVLGMYAFGLEECNQYDEAECTARNALEIEPKDGWAVHAGTHVMEMQGRIDEGIEPDFEQVGREAQTNGAPKSGRRGDNPDQSWSDLIFYCRGNGSHSSLPVLEAPPEQGSRRA